MGKISVNKIAVLPYRFRESRLELLLSPVGLVSSLVVGNAVEHGTQCKAASMLALAALGIRGRIHKHGVRGHLEPAGEGVSIFLLECPDQHIATNRYDWTSFQAGRDIYGQAHRQMFDDIFKRIQSVNRSQFR